MQQNVRLENALGCVSKGKVYLLFTKSNRTPQGDIEDSLTDTRKHEI